MTSSAITGNTSGLASATSPGLVGITTQTFAGKKTLDGGALIKGDTSGVAIASSYVGQVFRTSVASQSIASGSGAINLVTHAVGAGIWLVSGQFYGLPNTPAGAGIFVTDQGSTSTAALTGYNISGIILPKRDNDAYVGMATSTFYFISSSASSLYFNLLRNVVSSFTDANYSFTAVRIA